MDDALLQLLSMRQSGSSVTTWRRVRDGWIPALQSPAGIEPPAERHQGAGAITSRRTRGLGTVGRAPLSAIERRSLAETERRRAAGLIGPTEVVTVAQLLREEGRCPSP